MSDAKDSKPPVVAFPVVENKPEEGKKEQPSDNDHRTPAAESAAPKEDAKATPAHAPEKEAMVPERDDEREMKEKEAKESALKEKEREREKEKEREREKEKEKDKDKKLFGGFNTKFSQLFNKKKESPKMKPKPPERKPEPIHDDVEPVKLKLRGGPLHTSDLVAYGFPPDEQGTFSWFRVEQRGSLTKIPGAPNAAVYHPCLEDVGCKVCVQWMSPQGMPSNFAQIGPIQQDTSSQAAAPQAAAGDGPRAASAPENKTESNEAALSRLSDEIADLTERLSGSEAALLTARKDREEIKDELAKTNKLLADERSEHVAMVELNTQLKAENAKLKKDIVDQQKHIEARDNKMEDIGALQVTLRSLNESVSQYQKTEAARKEECSKLTQQNGRLRETIQQQSDQLQEMATRLKMIKDTNDASSRMLADISQKHRELEKSHTALKEENTALKAEAALVKKTMVNKETADAQAQLIQQLKVELDSEKRRVQNMLGEQQQRSALELVALRSEIDTCRESMRKQQAEIDKQKETYAQLQKKLSEEEAARGELKKQLEKCEQEKSAAQQEVQGLLTLKDTLTSERNFFRKKADSLSHDMERLLRERDRVSGSPYASSTATTMAALKVSPPMAPTGRTPSSPPSDAPSSLSSVRSPPSLGHSPAFSAAMAKQASQPRSRRPSTENDRRMAETVKMYQQALQTIELYKNAYQEQVAKAHEAQEKQKKLAMDTLSLSSGGKNRTAELQHLANQLLCTISEKDEVLTHIKKVNRLLGLRVQELETTIANQTTGQALTSSQSDPHLPKSSSFSPAEMQKALAEAVGHGDLLTKPNTQLPASSASAPASAPHSGQTTPTTTSPRMGPTAPAGNPGMLNAPQHSHSRSLSSSSNSPVTPSAAASSTPAAADPSGLP